MSRIEDMIAKLCPGGVDHRPLGDVGVFVRGNGVQKKDLVDEGVPAIHYGQIFTHYGTAAGETKSFVHMDLAAKSRRAQPGDLVIATTSENPEDVGKATAWLGDNEAVVSSDAMIFSHGMDPLYASYFFQSESFRRQKQRFISGTKVKRLSSGDLARIVVPIPPLAIQAEAASILVTMEELEADLEADLEAELEARRRQYEHYRDSLMGFADGGVHWKPMGEVGQFFRGRRFTKADYADEGVPCIHYGDIYTKYGTTTSSVATHVRLDLATTLRYAEYGDVVMVDVGETVDDVGKAVAWLGDEPVAIHDHCFAFRHAMNPSFVSHYMQTSAYRSAKAKYVARTKVKTLLMNGLAKVLVPVPPVEEQERIVAILDSFDALVNDLSSGLPAEVAARRKQYEYYRDKLLTFDDIADAVAG